MAENKNNDEIIDFDELEELPDVVLGEKTIAMRTMHENGTPVETSEEEVEKQEEQPSGNTMSRAFDRINVYDQTTVLPSVDNLLKQDIHVDVASEEDTIKEDVIEQPDPENKITVLDDTQDDLDLESLKKGQKYKKGTKLDYLGNEVEIEDFNPVTSRYKIVDNGKTKWVTDKNLKLIDPEIPASLQDEDPGVDDELSDALQETDNKTVAIEASGEANVVDELSKIYDEPKQSNEVIGRHARTNHENIVKTTVPFEEIYKEAIVETKPESEEEKIERMKRRKKTPLIQKIVTFILLLLIIVLCAGIYIIYDGLQPVSSTSEEVKFVVEEGSTAKDVADQLEEEGIIKNADVAYTYIRFLKLTDIKQGIFTLDKSWDLKQIFTYLNDELAASTDQAMVTIIEGDWAKDAASKFEEVTNVSADELLALWNNQEWISSQKDKYPFITDDMFKEDVRIYLEGYLAPNTYYINKETTAEEITLTLLDQTLTVYNKYADAIAQSGRSIADIYTMASIIQYEAGTNPDDLKKVASVFYNRLDQGMLLQSSVTVCYAIDFDKMTDNWQTCEYNPDYDSAYNTYLNAGLTPGPIENAGEAALEAAINPADTNYLYFMAETCPNEEGVVTGTVHYAETIEEHNANVAQYLTCY